MRIKSLSYFIFSIEKLFLPKLIVKPELTFLIVLILCSCNLMTGKKKATGTNRIKKDADVPYETPPLPPIPPETYCYQWKGGINDKDLKQLRLQIIGDSVFGNFEETVDKKTAVKCQIIGILYGNNMLVSNKCQTPDSVVTHDEEWKVVGDSVFKKTGEIPIEDTSAAAKVYPPTPIYEPALHKVPCD